jgi:hypothetical protein
VTDDEAFLGGGGRGSVVAVTYYDAPAKPHPSASGSPSVNGELY